MSKSLPKHTHNSQGGPPNEVGYLHHNNNFFEKRDNSLNPRKIISLLLKYKWIILLFLVAGAIGALSYAYVVTPVYQSTGSLMITSGDHSTSDALSNSSNVISQTTGYGTSSTLENELQVLRSRKFSREVAQRLLENKPKNIKQYPIYWQKLKNGTKVRASKKAIAYTIRNNIDFMQPDEKAAIVKIVYKSTSPKEAARVVNVVMHNYIDHSRQENRQAATSTAHFLKRDKEKLKEKLNNAERALRNYMDSTGIVQVNQQATSMVSQRANTGAELQNVNLKLRTVKKNIADYKKQLDNISPGFAKQLTDAVGPRIKASQKELAQYEEQRSALISKYPGILKHDTLPPRLQLLNKQIARLKGELKNLSKNLYTKNNEFTGINIENQANLVSSLQSRLDDLKIQQKQLEARKQALTRQKNQMDAKFNELPRGMVKLAKLKRNVKINEELYVNVSKKYSDISLLKNSQFGYGHIVDPAVIPGSPVSPVKKIYLLLGLMLGGLMAAGYISIREFRDNSVNDVGELKTIYLPSISVIPKIEEVTQENEKSFKKGAGKVPQEIVMINNRSGIAAEEIRRLKNNITYQNGESPPKSIVITSPEKGDGKSTLSANLAIAFAEEGYWTLVIDADFRQPKIQKYFGISDEHGLSDYLSGDISFENVLKETDLETLKLITAGRGAEMPDILSNSHKLKQLLKKMEDIFDVIIIDTPPYGVISDSSALLKYAEATILLAQHEKTNKGMLHKTMEELRQINANVTNIVLNNFNYRNESSSYYGNGYHQAMYKNYDKYKRI